jgi:hypothetical protein
VQWEEFDMSEVIAPVTVEASTGPSPAEVEALAALIPDTAIKGVDVGTAVTSVSPQEKIQIEQPTEPTDAPPAEATKTSDGVDTEALERAEAAAKRAREGSRRFREMQETQQREAAQRQAVQREAERLRQEAEEYRKLKEDLDRDPYAALKARGMTEQALAERALREGTPEQAIHELNRKLERAEQARVALEQRLQLEREESNARQVEQNFLKVADNDERYPRLAQLNSAAQLAVVRASLQQIVNNGYEVSGLSDEQVAEACEKFLAPKKGKAATKLAPTAAAAKPAPKTLTNAVATERAMAPKPWDELSDEEQIAQIAAMLPGPS